MVHNPRRHQCSENVGQSPRDYQVSRLIGKQWTRCVELGLDVGLDLGFWSRRERDETRFDRRTGKPTEANCRPECA